MTPLQAMGAVCAAILLAMLYDRLKRFIALQTQPPGTPSQRSVDIFLNRVIYATHYDKTRFVSFRIDCFLFDFRKGHPDGLDPDVQYEFFDYLRTLDLSQQQAIVKIYIWLRQHDINFIFRFQYNSSLPFKYNWQQRHKPAKLRKLLEDADQDQLMRYDLSKDPHALRK